MTALHIGVEASKLVRERRGIGRYVRNVLRHIPRVRDGARITLFLRTMNDEAAVREQLTSLDPLLLPHCSFQPLSALRRTDADVVWYPWNWLHPYTERAAMVTTICDLVPMLQLDHRWWKVIKRAKYRRRFRRTAERSDVLITISAFTAREVNRYLGVPLDDMHVTLLAADDLATIGTAAATTPATLGISGPFFMAVGAHEARKNLYRLWTASLVNPPELR